MEKIRKRPGRPRKRADANPVGVYGIIREPMDASHCVELVYNQPQLLKCIVSIFKEYDGDEIVMEFFSNRVVFTGRDHSDLVIIQIIMNAPDMNLYYFSAPDGIDRYRLIVKRDNLGIVAAIIEKTHYKMTMMLCRDDLTTLTFVLANCEYDNDDRFDVSVVPRPHNTEEPDSVVDLAQYPLEFTIDSHHLRRKIGELKKVTQDMIIKKIGSATDAEPADPEAAGAPSSAPAPTQAPSSGEDLEISFGATPRVVYTGIYKTAQKIKLRSTIPAGQLFVATINISRIRPLMAVNIPGGITFHMGNSDPHVIQVSLDQRADGHGAISAQLQIWTPAD
jgi:hypothetical protein